MYKILFTVLCLTSLFFSCHTPKQVTLAGVEPYKPESMELHDTIVRLDSLFFDSYNNCKLDVFASMVSEDLEFYHDRGGVSTSKPGLVESIRNNICGKVQRELLPGSIEVYPIPNFGAVEMGAHRFHNLVEKSRSRYAKFVHIWHKENEGWKIARVISLH